MKGPASLQGRLAVLLLVSVPLIWLMATGFAVYAAHHEVDELYDTQLTLFARQLLTVQLTGEDDERPPTLPDTKHLIGRGDAGGTDDDDIGVAVWDQHGALLLADGKGKRFTYDPERRGFFTISGKHEHDWRLFYLPAPDGSRLVAVGQRQSLRHEVVSKVIQAQVVPWLFGLPVLLLLILWAVRRGLRPLQRLAESLRLRQPGDRTPLPESVPSETLPLVQSLNALFNRVAETLEREQRFTADAAHELRTPLAALKVQAEVIGLMPDDASRQRALAQLQLGIDRATRLIEQLLALSRLDPMSAPVAAQPIDWARLSERVLSDVQPAAQQKHITLARNLLVDAGAVLPLTGDDTLIGLLLRNLLDNAIRYSPDGAEVVLELSAERVAVIDNGPGIDPQWLARVRERFFRPPGQDVAGSGLGLSIVERIAELHGLTLDLNNQPAGGLIASLHRR
ncbi:MAG TPA: ATP-binding protein [Chromobacteriaceae bacterium]|nr:ATP-binding protein [Chromobacteriaceae bacterium]